MLCKGPEKGHHVSGSGATPLRSPSASPPSFSMQGPGKGSLAFFRKWGDPPPLPLGFFPPPPLALFFPSPSSSPPRALSVSISLALSLPLLLFLRRPWRRPRRRGRAVREEPRRRAVPASAEPRHCRRPLPRARRECRAPPPPFVAAGGSHRREKREKKLMFSSKELGRGKSKHRDSEQQKKLRTHENVQTMSASDPLGISSKVMGSGKRKQIDSEPKKKCTVCTCKECTRKTKGMDSKQQKRQGSLKEDTMESFNVHCFPEHPREKKLRGTKERCKNSEKQKKLDTNSFELFLKYMWSKLSDVKRKTCTYLDCLWFSSYMNEPSYSKVIMWIKKKQIFSRKYVFVPITGWRHWSLLILCHFGESFLSKTKRPCLLLLDSLGNINSMHLEPDIRRFVFDIYKSEGCEDEESISKIPLLVPKVPQQRDGESCGIFVLYFIHLFSQDAPEAFNQEGYPYFLTKNWFSYEDIEKFYKEVLHFATTSDAGEETVLRLDEASLGEAALKALPDRQGGPTHNIAPTEPLISGLLAEASRMESSPAQIVEKSPSEVAPHVDSTPVVSEEGGVAETESMAMDIQPIELESTPVDFPPPVSEKESSSAVEPGCMAISSLVAGALEVPTSFPALGIEWPDGPHFEVMLRSPEVAAELAQSLDSLLQINPLLTIEAMRSRLVECTRGYYAFGLPRDAWMAKLTALWDEFGCLHATQEQRQRIQMMIRQEEEQLCKIRATQADVYAQAEAARELGRSASLRVEELQRDLRQAQEECSTAQIEAETLQGKLDGLHREVLLSETRIADLRRSEL